MEKKIEVSFGSYLLRVVLSMASIAIFGFINFILNTGSTLVSGKMAGAQFQSSDTAYVASNIGMYLTGHLGLSSLILIFILGVLWYKPFRVYQQTIAVVAGLLFLSCMNVTSAHAYYDKMDYTEAYFILPNESSFFIPDVGDNKGSQSKFGSTAYLEERKIPAKRFTIPHTKFAGSGVWSDYYVPSGRLIIVDRTPYNREWTASKHRGTSTNDQSFPCQSSEGLNVTVEMSIEASVTEDDASKFLYNFGVKPPAGDRTQPAVIFTSVFYGKSLLEVMEGVGRGAVQTAVCSEISTRTLDKVNVEADKILTAVNVKSKTWFESKGITLGYLGWAGTFSFDADIQDAINRVYVAEKQKAIAGMLAPHVDTIQAIASADALRTVANKFDGKLPTSLSLWSLPEVVTKMFSGSGKDAKSGVAAPKQ